MDESSLEEVLFVLAFDDQKFPLSDPDLSAVGHGKLPPNLKVFLTDGPLGVLVVRGNGMSSIRPVHAEEAQRVRTVAECVKSRVDQLFVMGGRENLYPMLVTGDPAIPTSAA